MVAPPRADGRDAVRFGAPSGSWPRTASAATGSSASTRPTPASGAIAFTSPLARALLGKRRGDTVRLRAPRGDEELEIASVEYEDG